MSGKEELLSRYIQEMLSTWQEILQTASVGIYEFERIVESPNWQAIPSHFCRHCLLEYFIDTDQLQAYISAPPEEAGLLLDTAVEHAGKRIIFNNLYLHLSHSHNYDPIPSEVHLFDIGETYKQVWQIPQSENLLAPEQYQQIMELTQPLYPISRKRLLEIHEFSPDSDISDEDLQNYHALYAVEMTRLWRKEKTAAVRTRLSADSGGDYVMQADILEQGLLSETGLMHMEHRAQQLHLWRSEEH